MVAYFSAGGKLLKEHLLCSVCLIANSVKLGVQKDCLGSFYLGCLILGGAERLRGPHYRIL